MNDQMRCQARARSEVCSRSSRRSRRAWRTRIGWNSWSSLRRASGALKARRPRGLSIANASQHLQQMRRAGLVVAGGKASSCFYRLADDAVLELLASLRRVAEHNLAEVDRSRAQLLPRARQSGARLARGAMERLKAGIVTVLDVRPKDEFALGHVPGAINIPLGELEKRLAELDPDQEIVAYCRGPYCVLSYEAVAMLRARGFRVRRLEDGLPEWRAPGCRSKQHAPTRGT